MVESTTVNTDTNEEGLIAVFEEIINLIEKYRGGTIYIKLNWERIEDKIKSDCLFDSYVDKC